MLDKYHRLNYFIPSLIAATLIIGLASSVQAYDVNSKDRTVWRQKAQAALEAGDYAAWLSAHHPKFRKMVSKERFDKLREFKRLLSEGKEFEARQYAHDHNLGDKHLLKKCRRLIKCVLKN